MITTTKNPNDNERISSFLCARFSPFSGFAVSNHAVRVLRMKEGDELRVTDGVGNFYDCTITMASRSNCLLQVDREYRDTKSWKGQIHLVVAPNKNMDRMEWLAEKATEIGMDRISFIDC